MLGDATEVCHEEFTACRMDNGTCQMSFQVADCRNMAMFQDGSFRAVLDKGTMDAMLCADDDTGNASKMLAEAYRVLQNGELLSLQQFLSLPLCLVSSARFPTPPSTTPHRRWHPCDFQVEASFVSK